MLRKTMIVLAAAAALCGGLTDDAFALATGHTGWDGLGDGVGHPSLMTAKLHQHSGRCAALAACTRHEVIE